MLLIRAFRAMNRSQETETRHGNGRDEASTTWPDIATATAIIPRIKIVKHAAVGLSRPSILWCTWIPIIFNSIQPVAASY